MAKDLLFKFDSLGASPYFRVSDFQSADYLNNSLEGITFDSPLAIAGTTALDFRMVTPISGLFTMADYRTQTAGMDKSYYSTFLSPKQLVDFASGFRVITSDMYLKFKFTSSDVPAKGGIHPDVFNLKIGTDLSKPVFWAWFFGGSYGAVGNTAFQTAFNSYAVVLRPSGYGTNLEFALLKFDYGPVTSVNWFGSLLGSNKMRRYNTMADGATADLGYLISTNANIKDNNVPVCSEIAKSNDFLYDSGYEFRVNLNLSIKKHILSDGDTTGTYLVQLGVNENYGIFGPSSSVRYNSILHAFVSIPLDTSTSPKRLVSNPTDYRLLPMMYFKYVNLAQNTFGAAASRITLDNFLYRQANSSDTMTYKRY